MRLQMRRRVRLRVCLRGGLRARLRLALLLGVFCAAPLAAQTPALIPMPREVAAGPLLPLARGVAVRTASRDPEDRFAAEDLRASLAGRGIPVRAAAAATVELVRSQTPAGRALLASSHQTLTPEMRAEGYVLVPRRRGLAVVAASGAGLFYGAQTVKQLVVGSGSAASLQSATVRDWPALEHRGLDDDLSRGPVPTLDFQKRQIRTLAAYKLNIYSPYFEHTLAYTGSPLAAPPGGAMTPADVAELVAYAARYHITVVPEQEAFGHLHHVLKYELYAPLAETPHGHVLSPVQPGSLDLIRSWFQQIAAEFPSPWVHIGADETNELGRGQTRDRVEREGLSQVYVDFLKQVHAVIQPTGRRILFWGDLAWHDPARLAGLPRDMIGVPWVYDAEPAFDRYISPFRQAGLEVWVAPGVNNWRRVYPDSNIALVNIGNFVRDGQRLGARGMLNTVWNDDGEGIFDEDWYGVLFGAAAAWQPGAAPVPRFAASYGAVFHGDASGRVNQAQAEIMAAHRLLVEHGFRFGASNGLFWEDPWSEDGRADAARLRPLLHDLRLHAEQALVLTAQARAAGPLRETEALDALELGARRIDFIGMKFQFADEIARLYADAYAEAGKPHSRAFADLVQISNANGRCQDLRDGYTLTRELFRQAWLRDNRPYWLENVLAQYDLATQLWITRAARFDSLRARLSSSHSLPKPEEIGVPPAAGD